MICLNSLPGVAVSFSFFFLLLTISTLLGDLMSAASSFLLMSAPGTDASVVLRGGGCGVSNSPIEGTGLHKRSFPVVLELEFDRLSCFGALGVGSASFCICKNCKIS